MTNLIEQAVAPLIAAEDSDERFLNYVDAVDGAIVLQDDELEVVGIKRDTAGNVVVATTRKLPNLRFNLGELLLEVTGTVVLAAGSIDKPLKLALTGIRFLRTLGKLSTVEIGKGDAEVLIAVFRLAQEETVVRVGDLPGVLPAGWDEVKVALSLERLERLACIELGMDGIVVNEVIVVKGEGE